MKLFYRLIIITFLATFTQLSQAQVLKGTVYNEKNKETIPFAVVAVQETDFVGQTDLDGNYIIEGIDPGVYNLEVDYTGFEKKVIYQVKISTSKPTVVDFYLKEQAMEIEEIVIETPYSKTVESPVSLRKIGVEEIERYPGGNRDISFVIQSLPGVASSPGFRNDIIIRGGAPSENSFYLDGVEVPTINHFSTQGSSGGPVGILNVNLINEVEFYSGAWTSNRGGTLSSVFEFELTEGNEERLGKRFTIGSTDIGLTLDGPIGKKANFIFSVRRSYLQLLFEVLQLPFLPTYNDAQYKIHWEPNDNNEVTFIGLGAYDDFELNTKVNDGITDQETIERNNYIINNLPENDQWNYTVGTVWKNYREKSNSTVVLSRNHLKNIAVKFEENDESKKQLLNYTSQEIENKLRLENLTFHDNGMKSNVGMSLETATYTNSTYSEFANANGVTTKDFSSRLDFFKYGLFGQLTREYLDNRLGVSVGLRMDGNSYNDASANPLEHLSPRLSLSYQLKPKWYINFNTGRYYQLPAYTVLGYESNEGELVNKGNDVSYIRCDHIVAGVEYRPKDGAKITVEGFYKAYADYPFLLRDSITLANLGSDFGVVGNDAAVSRSKGRAYGVELLAQQKLVKGFFGILAYTFVRSEFQDKNNNYVFSSWDNRHIINRTLGKKLKKNWQIGAKFRFSGGAPYTPYDLEASSQRTYWDVNGEGIPDWDNLNTGRLNAFHGLDIRIDKDWYFDKWSLNLYLDIQNIYNFKAQNAPYVDVVRDENGQPVVENPGDPVEQQRYELKEIENTSGTILPTLGVIVDF